jgi:hypothetical protein
VFCIDVCFYLLTCSPFDNRLKGKKSIKDFAFVLKEITAAVKKDPLKIIQTSKKQLSNRGHSKAKTAELQVEFSSI